MAHQPATVIQIDQRQRIRDQTAKSFLGWPRDQRDGKNCACPSGWSPGKAGLTTSRAGITGELLRLAAIGTALNQDFPFGKTRDKRRGNKTRTHRFAPIAQSSREKIRLTCEDSTPPSACTKAQPLGDT